MRTNIKNKRILTVLSQMTSNSDTTDYLREKISNLQDELSNAYKALDKVFLQKYLDSIYKITSISQAISARDFYDTDWFKKVTVSPEAKRRLAQGLLGRTKLFNIQGNEVWQQLANGTITLKDDGNDDDQDNQS